MSLIVLAVNDRVRRKHASFLGLCTWTRTSKLIYQSTMHRLQVYTMCHTAVPPGTMLPSFAATYAFCRQPRTKSTTHFFPTISCKECAQKFIFSTASRAILKIRPEIPQNCSIFDRFFFVVVPLSDPYHYCFHRIAPYPSPTASPRTEEADWRTKDNVDFNWGFLSPEPGVNRFGASLSGSSSSNNSGKNASYVHAWNSSNIFPADYFSARFTGFGETPLTKG